MLGLAVLLTFASAFLLVLILVSLWERLRQSRMRLLRDRLGAAKAQKTTIRLFRDNTMSTLPLLQRWLSRAAFAGKLRRYLEQADISQPVGLVLGVVLLLGILSGRVVWILTSSWSWSVLGAAMIGSLPLFYVARRRRLRLGLYAEQLPEALDVLVRALRAGHSFLQGVQAVARDMPDPAGTEFRMTFEELRLGRTLRDALQSHAHRVQSLDFNLIATALLIQREVGGNLTEILENSSRTIRERFKLLGQIRALSSQNWLAGKIICGLPFAIGVMIYFLRPDLIMILFKDETGRNMMAVALVMQIMGFFAMKRIMTIKV